MNKIYIPFEDSISLIKEADVFLFRPKERKKWYSLPSIGNLIAIYTGGEYSHVGIASCEHKMVVIIEFREWIGGRCSSLANQLEKHSGYIDVFRVLPEISVPQLKIVETEGKKIYNTVEEKIKFTPETAEKITNEMYKLTGLPYGWKIIFKLFKAYLPGIRLLREKHKFDNDVEEHIYVCSSAVNFCFRKHYFDPVPGIADSYTKPSDIAQSPLFKYQFTII